MSCPQLRLHSCFVRRVFGIRLVGLRIELSYSRVTHCLYMNTLEGSVVIQYDAEIDQEEIV